MRIDEGEILLDEAGLLEILGNGESVIEVVDEGSEFARERGDSGRGEVLEHSSQIGQ